MQAPTVIIKTVTELMHIWLSLRTQVGRDLSSMARLMSDPEAAFLAEGYQVAGPARDALLAAVPH